MKIAHMLLRLNKILFAIVDARSENFHKFPKYWNDASKDTFSLEL